MSSLNMNAVLNVDPTHTKTLRNSFVGQMNKRFRWLRGMIRKAIVDKDALALARVQQQFDRLPNKREFDFETSSKKVEQFMQWLDRMEDAGILTTEVIPSGRGRVAADERWTDLYIRPAYKQGIERGKKELEKAGAAQTGAGPSSVNAAFGRPIHADSVGLAYTRTYTNLQGITDEIDTKISQILADGIARGDGPRNVADRINNEIQSINKKRARMLARTEIIRAHHMATMNEYEAAGISNVKIKAEWTTAGWNVCPLCRANEGRVYELSEIKGLIPLHPNCRCVAIPLVE